MAESIKSSLYWNVLLRIPVKFICFALSIYIARLLEPTDYGIMAIVMLAIGYANMITNFGLNGAIIQKTIHDKNTINSIFSFDLSISIIIAIVFFFGADGISQFFNEARSSDVIKLMSLYFITSSFLGVSHAVLRRDMNFLTLATLESMSSLSTSILTLVFALLGYGYWSLAYGQIIPQFIFTIIFCFKADWVPKIKYNHTKIKPIFDFGLWSFVRNQRNFLVNHIEIILIGKVVGSHDLGLYTKAKGIAVMPSEMIFMNMNSVLFSSFSQNREDKDMLWHYFSKSITLIGLLSFPISIGFILVAPYFVASLLGEKWIGMVSSLQFLSAGYLFKAFGGTLASFNIGVGSYKAHTLWLILSGLFFLIMCLALIDYGIVWISLAFFIYCILEFFLSLFLAVRVMNLKIIALLPIMIPLIFYTSVMGCVVYLLGLYLHELTFVNMLIMVMVGVVSYLLTCFYGMSRSSEDVKYEIYNDALSVTKKIFRFGN